MTELAEPMREGDLSVEPLAEAHREALKAACAQDLDLLLRRATWQPFAILLNGEVVGVSAYISIEPDRGVLEIGNTYYVPRLRGTGFNERVKDLMIGRAIVCGFRRIEFRVDARNTRPQSAVVKIGGVKEGVLRADRITWTGHVRDTVLFSVLAHEWQAR